MLLFIGCLYPQMRSTHVRQNRVRTEEPVSRMGTGINAPARSTIQDQIAKVSNVLDVSYTRIHVMVD